MENKLWPEKWVRDVTGFINSGLPIQIIKIDGSLAQVWFPNGIGEFESEYWIDLEHLS